MFELEDNHWWYLGLRALVCSSLNRILHKSDRLRILDVGCGTGGLLARCGANKAFGLDLSDEAIRFCKLRKLNNRVIKASACAIPFNEQSFDLIVSLDVLYHRGVGSDLGALKEFYRILDQDGLVFLNLPAYDFLRSEHDRAIHTGHRYTRKELGEKVEKAGFEIEKITYRNTILFPWAVVKRFWEGIFLKNGKIPRSDLRPLPDLINKLLACLLLLENRFIVSIFSFPFGLSLFCIARKSKPVLSRPIPWCGNQPPE